MMQTVMWLVRPSIMQWWLQAMATHRRDRIGMCANESLFEFGLFVLVVFVVFGRLVGCVGWLFVCLFVCCVSQYTIAAADTFALFCSL